MAGYKKRVIQESDDSDSGAASDPENPETHLLLKAEQEHVPISKVAKEGFPAPVDTHEHAPQPNKPKRSRSDSASSAEGTPIASTSNNRRSSESSVDQAISQPAKKVKTEEGASLPSFNKKKSANGKATNGTPANGKADKKKAKPKKESSEDEEMDADDSESDNEPMSVKKKPPPKAAKKPKAKADKVKEPPKKKVKKEETPSAMSSPVKKGKGKAKKEEDEEEGNEEGDDDEEEAKWFEQEVQEGGPKWTTLQHAGVLFPDEYTPLPSNVKMKYDGVPLSLPPEAEEVAGFFAAMMKTDHAEKPVFVKNFFEDWQAILKKHPPRENVKITDFDKCDFEPMYEYFEVEKEKKKAMTKDEKKAAKALKDKLEERYKIALIDGKKETVGNFRVEPPGLFRGRGAHPKTGKLKYRLRANDITINIGKDAEIPDPPPGQKWAEVRHDPTVTWLATWKENINNNTKYVFLAATSAWKGQSDMKKFEKARKLKEHVDKIREDYMRDLTDKVMATRQRATATYFIDRFALRAGNEKGEDEADTVGCCSLRYEHVSLAPPNLVTFDFPGKDSIRYYQPDKEVDEQVFKNLKIFKKAPKAEGDLLFDRLTTTILNKYLTDYMPGLTAKVFRTYNASITLQRELQNTPADASIADKILHYNRANRLVAELCNHQRSVSKGHTAAMEKLNDKGRTLKYQRMKLRHALFNLDSDYKKSKEFKEPESDLEDDWLDKHEVDLVAKERTKIEKKFEKDNAKLKEKGETEMTKKELKSLLEAADELEETLKEERKTKKVEPKKGQTAEKIITQIRKMDDKIAAHKITMIDKDEGKEISLTTSKINYMDPRITIAWCAKHEVPLNKMFSKTLLDKFSWARSVEKTPDWEF